MFLKVSESQSPKRQIRPVRNRKRPAKFIDSDDDNSNFAAVSFSKKVKEEEKGFKLLNFFVWLLLYFLYTFFFLSFRKRKSQRPKPTGLQAKKIRPKPTCSQAQKIRKTNWGGFNVLKITLLALYWWIQKGQKRFATIYLFQTCNYCLFQLIGHFVSTHLWVDSECPTFFLARHFFTPTLVQFLILFGTWNYRLFQLKVAFRVYSYLSGFGMPYFFFGPSFFSFWHLLIFWCFSQHETIFFFQLIGHFESTCVWVDSECPTFFWPVVF